MLYGFLEAGKYAESSRGVPDFPGSFEKNAEFGV
jgi:hypothetical protein